MMVRTVVVGHKAALRVIMVASLLVVLGLLLGGRAAQADTTFTVNSTRDTEDLDLGNGACFTGELIPGPGGLEDECTLRAAIQEANATDGADTISFSIPGDGVHTIAPTSRPPFIAGLPFITEAVTIDGYSQPGSRPNTLEVGNDAVLNIELDGTNTEFATGLAVLDAVSNCVIRGLVINNFQFNGISVAGTNNTNNKIEGNFLGTDPSGTQAEGNESGVSINGGTNNTIGGTTPEARNLISGNDFGGVGIGNGASNNKVFGNYIGTKRDGRTRLGNGDVGVGISSASENTIGGGTAAGAANKIAFNESDGVLIVEGDPDDSNGNRILNNSIHSNFGLGIDLVGDDGPEPNDPNDADEGANTLQNKPNLTSATTTGTQITIQGRLRSTPSSNFTIRFFANRELEPAGYEGRTFLGKKSVTTNANGVGTFTRVVAEEVEAGQGITATATGPGGNTSEFSGPREVVRQ